MGMKKLTSVANFKIDFTDTSIDDWDWYKKTLLNFIDTECLKLKGQKNLLFLSDGLDSFPILYGLIRNNIDFIAVNFTNNTISDNCWIQCLIKGSFH